MISGAVVVAAALVVPTLKVDVGMVFILTPAPLTLPFDVVDACRDALAALDVTLAAPFLSALPFLFFTLFQSWWSDSLLSSSSALQSLSSAQSADLFGDGFFTNCLLCDLATSDVVRLPSRLTFVGGLLLLYRTS
jgi:hypothetical protein